MRNIRYLNIIFYIKLGKKIYYYFNIMKELILILLGILVLCLCLCKKHHMKKLKKIVSKHSKKIMGDLDIVPTNIFYYTPQTVTDELKEELKKVIKTIIHDINGISEVKYYPGEYNHIIVDENDDGDKRLIVDMFIYDIKNYYDVRVAFDIVNIGGKYNLNDIKMVTKEDTKSIKDKLSCSYETGVESTSLYNSVINNYTNYLISLGNVRNKWIVNEQLSKKCKDNTPEHNQLCSWDKDSVMKNFKKDTFASLPTYNPTIVGLPHHSKDQNSMFNLTYGIIDFP